MPVFLIFNELIKAFSKYHSPFKESYLLENKDDF